MDVFVIQKMVGPWRKISCFLIKICWIRLMYFVLRCPHYTFNVFLSGASFPRSDMCVVFLLFRYCNMTSRMTEQNFSKRNIINRTLFWERFTWSMTTSSKLIISCCRNLLGRVKYYFLAYWKSFSCEFSIVSSYHQIII